MKKVSSERLALIIALTVSATYLVLMYALFHRTLESSYASRQSLLDEMLYSLVILIFKWTRRITRRVIEVYRFFKSENA